MNAAEIRYLIQSRADQPEQLHWLGDREAEALAGLAAPEERALRLLERWAAKRAVFAVLARAGQARRYSDIEIRGSGSGAPEIFLSGSKWPMALSLSASPEEALCVVGPAGTAIGCDLARVEARGAGFVEERFTGAEKARWEAAPAEDRDAFGCLVWSAKQSARKALGVGYVGRERVLEVDLGGAEVDGFRPVAVKLEEGGGLAGFGRHEGSCVFTIVGIGVMTPPVPLNSDRRGPAPERRRGARTP